jgi:hypothetical protein
LRDKKFDYCLLLAAKKDKACPQHVFVIKCEEMTKTERGVKGDHPWVIEEASL